MIRTFIFLFCSLMLLPLQLRIATASSIIEQDSDTNSNDVQQPSTIETPESSFRSLLGGFPGRRLGKIGQVNSREKIDALRKVLQNAPPDSDWRQFAPPQVSQAETNCYVEVQVTQKMPGRCTKLGGRIPACQAQELVTIDYGSCK